MKKIIISLLLLLFTISINASTEKYVTKNCAIYVQINKVNSLFTQVERYAALFGKKFNPGAIANLVSMNLFGSAGFPGIDINREIAFIMHMGKEIKNSVVIFLPINDIGIFKSKTALMIHKKNKQTVISYKNGYAIIASSRQGLREVLSGKRKRVNMIKDYSISVYADNSILKKMITSSLSKLKYKLPMRDNLKILNKVIKFYTDMINQIKSYNFALNLDRRGIGFGYAIDTVPEGWLADMTKGIRDGSLQTLQILPADSFMITSSKVNFKSYSKLISMILPIYENIIGKNTTGLINSIAKELPRIYGDEISTAFLPGKGSAGLNFAAVLKSKSKLRSIAMFNTIARTLQNSEFIKKAKREGGIIKFTFSKNAEMINDNPVHLFRLSINVSGDNPPPANAMKIIKLLNQSMVLRISHVGPFELIAFGNESKSRLTEMMNIMKGRKNGFKSSEAYMKIRRHFGQYHSTGIFHVSLLKVIGEVLKNASHFDKQKQIAGMQKMLSRFTGKSSGIYGYSSIKKNRILVRGIFSKTELFNIARMVIMMTMDKSR